MLLGSLLSSPHRSVPKDSLSAGMQRMIGHLAQLLEPPVRKNQRYVLPKRLLDVTAEQLTLADQTQLWLDADAFETLLQEARKIDDPSAQEQRIEQALLLYQGDYWPDAHATPGVRERRERLRRQWIGALLIQADFRVARGDTSGAIDALDRLLAADSVNEAAVIRLMVVLSRVQRRGEAARLYQRFTALLGSENAATPSEQARTLYEALRRGESLDPWYPHHAAHQETFPGPGASGGMAPLDAQELPPIGRTGQHPLVGRETERATMHTMLLEMEQAAQTPRSPHFLLLAGDVGIGKTRLAEEMAREAQARGWLVLWIHAHALESDIPYRVWTEALRGATHLPGWPRQAIAEHPQQYAALGALLSEVPGLPPAQALPPSTEQEPLRLWEAMRALFETMSDTRPLCLVLDDMHWLDSSSCALLGYLVRQLRSMPVLLVGTIRENELATQHPLAALLSNLRRDQAARMITLAPLTQQQVSVLVSDLPDAVASTIHSLADGNPLFAEELARAAQISPLALDQPSNLPGTITAALNLRLSRLSQECQRLLTRAAVLGGSFVFSSLALLEGSGSTTEEERLVDLLDEAIQAGVLVEEGNGTRTTYTFWHPLAISHLANSLSATRRASLHRRAAAVLQQVYRDREEEGAAAIASHLVSAGAEPAEVVHYAEQAGDYAYRLSAYSEASRHYHQALSERERRRHAAPAPIDPDEQARLALLVERLGEAAMIQGQYAEAELSYTRVIELRSANRLEEDAPLLALCWAEIGWAKRYLGEVAQAWQYHQRGESLLQQAGEVGGPAWAGLRYQYGNFAWQEGRYQEAEQAAHEALTLFEQHLQQASPSHAMRASTRLQRTLVGNPADTGRVHILLAAILATIGQSAAAASHLQTALIIFEQEDHLREIAIVSGNLGDLYLRQDDYEQAQASFRRSLNIAERMGDLPIACVNYGNLGVLAGRLGNLVDAEHLLRRALALAERVGDPVYHCLWLAYLAFFLQEAGKDEEARGCILRALTLSRAKALAVCAGFALVTLGQMRLAQARAARAVHERSGPRDADIRLLRRARITLLHALANSELETEMRVEGQTALAEVLLLLGEPALAEQYARQALAEARRAELTRLATRAEWLLETAHM
jgi:tetratricopeptide (TPR) repeat protein